MTVIATDKEFCSDKKFLLKSSYIYFAQVKMQIYIYGLKACHLVISTPMSFLFASMIALLKWWKILFISS